MEKIMIDVRVFNKEMGRDEMQQFSAEEIINTRKEKRGIYVNSKAINSILNEDFNLRTIYDVFNKAMTALYKPYQLEKVSINIGAGGYTYFYKIKGE